MFLQTRLLAAESGDVIKTTKNYKLEAKGDENAENVQNYGAPLVLANKSNITIEGNHSVIEFTTHGNGLLIANCDNIKIKNIIFKGQKPQIIYNKRYYALVLLAGTNKNLIFENCQFINSGAHGVAHLFGKRDTNHCKFINCYFEEIGNLNVQTLNKDGAAIAIGGSDNLFDSCTFVRCLRSIELESGEWDGPCQRNIITNCKFLQPYWQGIYIAPVNKRTDLFNQLIISNNIFEGWGKNPEPWPDAHFPHQALYCGGTTGLQFIGNSVSNMWDGCGITLGGDNGVIENVIISNNLFNNIDRSGVHAISGGFAVSKILVCNNHFNDIKGVGVWLKGRNSQVSNNIFINTNYRACYEEESGLTHNNQWTNNMEINCSNKFPWE